MRTWSDIEEGTSAKRGEKASNRKPSSRSTAISTPRRPKEPRQRRRPSWPVQGFHAKAPTHHYRIIGLIVRLGARSSVRPAPVAHLVDRIEQDQFGHVLELVHHRSGERTDHRRLVERRRFQRHE